MDQRERDELDELRRRIDDGVEFDQTLLARYNELEARASGMHDQVFPISMRCFHCDVPEKSSPRSGSLASFLLRYYLTAGFITYVRYSYKNYLLRAYIHETDPIQKVIIAGRFPFYDAELRGAELFWSKYKRTPRTWMFMYPLSFVAHEIVVKRCLKFWR